MRIFLQRNLPDAAAGSVISSPDGVEAVLVGTYASMKGRDMFGGAMGTDWTYGSITSDDCYKGTSAGDETSFNLIERYEIGVTDPYMHARWRDCYEGVARANSALECLAANQTGDRPIPEPRASQIEAEAKFLRAWFHFQANKVFEKIPYIKTKRNSPLCCRNRFRIQTRAGTRSKKTFSLPLRIFLSHVLWGRLAA